jgi:hypothetical protein
MGEDRHWMYDGWKKNGAHTDEWGEKTDDFIVHFLGNYSKYQVSMSQMSKHEVCRQGHIDETPHQEWFRYRL